MLQYRCDACGHVETVAQTGPVSSSDCAEPDDPPAGWRSFYTMAQEHDGEGGIETTAGTVLYTCRACNEGADVDEQLWADHAARLARIARPVPGVTS